MRHVPALMIQGTGSDVGKSLLVAGLCRVFARRGLNVRPFKPQNMSNNAAVTVEGGEIGRAQALQARAAGILPSIHMNPVLLKPETDTGAQVVVQGTVAGRAEARAYQGQKPDLLPAVMESFALLSEGADLVLIEGAGSPAEVNLRKGDIANMGFAEAADVPVVLVGDIERGGVIAAIVGTREVITKSERERIRGFIVNKFRGDPTLFEDGVRLIEARTHWPCFGVVPFLSEARLFPAEDSLPLAAYRESAGRGIRVLVPVLSRLANFDDFDPLLAEPDVSIEIVPPGKRLPEGADLVILGGTKATLRDLHFLREQGWEEDLHAHHAHGGWILGICGGYQMLGRRVSDPHAMESEGGAVEGLGFLDCETVLDREKRLHSVEGSELASKAPIHGYEMHLGRTEGPALKRPFFELAGKPEGARSEDGRILGTYLHGLFAADDFRHAFLNRIRPRKQSRVHFEHHVEQMLGRLADHLEASLKIEDLLNLAKTYGGKRR
ncbi:MAG: cobyric acid synthase [Alphaproteobacteria bacterium]